MRLSLLILVCFTYCLPLLPAQETFSRFYDFDYGPKDKTHGFILQDDKIIVLVKHTCFFNNEICFSINHFDLKGDFIKQNIVYDFISGWETSLVEYNDSLFVSGQINNDETGTRVNYLAIGNMDMSAYRKQAYVFNMDPAFRPNNTGLILHDGYIYLYGNVLKLNHGIAKAQIIKIDAKTKELVWEKQYGGNTINQCQSLQVTPDSNLVFINKLILPSPEEYFFTTIDTLGNIVHEFMIPEYSRIEHPRILASKDGFYYYTSTGEPDASWIYPYGWINKVHPLTEEILWSVPLPRDPFINNRDYQVYDFLEASNGDILACGYVFDEEGEVSNNGFIIRLTPEGDIRWFRMYKLPSPNEVHTEFWRSTMFSELQEIKEKEDGGFIARGIAQYFNRDTTIGMDIWLLSVDANGCIDSNNCEGEVLLVETKEIPMISQRPKLYPNPVTNLLYTEVSENYDAYKIYDSMGQLQQQGVFSTAIDVSKLPASIYFIQFFKNNQPQVVAKIIKL